MEKVVITIARQYGSGGKTIGKMLAADLGVKAYDREILRLASEDSGINEALFNQVDEHLKGSSLFRFMKKEYHGELIPPESGDFLSDQNMFNYQAKVIRDLAEEESCVIIGRCGDYVLKDFPNVVRVFIHAPHDFCHKMTVERGSRSEKEADKYMEDIDKYRGEYYHYYTGQEWFDARNYDLTLNSAVLGFEGCVDAIEDYIGIRFGNDWKTR